MWPTLSARPGTGNEIPPVKINRGRSDDPANGARHRSGQGFGIPAKRVDTVAGFDAVLAKSLAKTDGPTPIEVMVKS